MSIRGFGKGRAKGGGGEDETGKEDDGSFHWIGSLLSIRRPGFPDLV